jgi:preprotein translocase SecF subunit
MQFFKHTHIDFIGKRKAFYVMSIVITLAGLIAAFTRGVEYGIDFEGGTEASYEFARPINVEDVRGAVDAGGYRGAEIKTFDEPNQILIRVKNPEHKAATAAQTQSDVTKVADALKSTLQKRFPDNPVQILQYNNVGPKIGAELRLQALYAVLASIVAILLYVAFRFEWLFGVGAVVALVHDVLVAFAFAVIFNGLFGLNLEMNQGMLAAFLTVVGFSINDTVIIFDRIRENRQLHRGENLMMLMNRSINETLPRTINTSLTVALVLVVLLIFSGEVLRGFAFTMLIGILTGTYSSIYIASALVVDIMIKQGKLDPKAQREFTDQFNVAKADRERRTGAVARI